MLVTSSLFVRGKRLAPLCELSTVHTFAYQHTTSDITSSKNDYCYLRVVYAIPSCSPRAVYTSGHRPWHLAAPGLSPKYELCGPILTHIFILTANKAFNMTLVEPHEGSMPAMQILRTPKTASRTCCELVKC